jgi:hypothetical protein
MRAARNTDYQAVAASQSAKALGPAGGKKGDIIEQIIVSISTSGANGTVSIQDGSNAAITIAPASTPVGVFAVVLGARSSNGAWQVTTGSAATALAIGSFT